MADTSREGAGGPGGTAREAEAAAAGGTAREDAAGGGGSTGAGPVNLVPVLMGRYTFVRYLGGGGEGHVLLVQDRAGAQFVVKQYAPGWHANEDVLERLRAARGSMTRQQWGAHHRLRHAVWLEEWDTFAPWNVFYEVQEFIPGGALDRAGSLAAWPVRELAAALTASVSTFHEVAGAHRDVKPANVLVRSVTGPILVLTDVGLARVVADGSKRFSARDGTAAYQAPEAALGQVTRSGDWWSVGMIVAEAALGAHPMALDDGTLPPNQVISTHLAQRNVPQLDRIADARIRLLCEGLLTRDADLRWDEEQVGQWLAGESPATGFGTPVTVAGASAAEAGPERVRLVRFAGAEHDTPAALAAAFAADPRRAGGALFEQKDGQLLEEVRAMLRAAHLSEARSVLDSYRSGAWEPTMLRLLVEMDPELDPALDGQSLTPSAVARVAQSVVESGVVTPAQARTMSWVSDHDAWKIWRGVPGMEQAGDVADRLAAVRAEVAAGLTEVGASGAGPATRLAVSVPSGALAWGGVGTEMVSSAVATSYWDRARPVARAWTILRACSPAETAEAVDGQLAALRGDVVDQAWWTTLADQPDTGHRIIALLAAPLARQAHDALTTHQDEQARQAAERAEVARAEAHRVEATALLQRSARVRANRRVAYRRALRNVLIGLVVGLPATALAAVWAGYARPGTADWWPGHLVFIEVWVVALLAQQLIALWERVVLANRDAPSQTRPAGRGQDRWLWVGVFAAGLVVAAALFNIQAERTGYWYPMELGAGYLALAGSFVLAQLALSVRRVGGHATLRTWISLAVMLVLLGALVAAGLQVAQRNGVSTPVDVPVAGGFELTTVSGNPVRWDPCAGPIGVQVNYGNLTPDYRARAQLAVDEGIAQVSRATGLDFRYAGETEAVPRDSGRADRRTADDAIRIGFLPATEAMMAGMEVTDVVANLGSTDSPAEGVWRAITSADIQVRPKADSYPFAVLWGLAYASGLTNDTEGDIMAGRGGLGAYGPGDLAGLEAVGAGLGCLN